MYYNVNKFCTFLIPTSLLKVVSHETNRGSKVYSIDRYFLFRSVWHGSCNGFKIDGVNWNASMFAKKWGRLKKRVPNFEQKNYSGEDGTRQNGPKFHRNSACFTKQKLTKFRSKSFLRTEKIPILWNAKEMYC